MSSTSALEAIVSICQKAEKALFLNELESGLRKELPGRQVGKEELVKLINKALGAGHLKAAKKKRKRDGEEELCFCPGDPQKMAVAMKMSREEMLVMQLIEKAGDKGMWLRDIRNASRLQNQVPDILEELQKRGLIKCIKTAATKRKKIYMLATLDPPHEPFYDGQDLAVDQIMALKLHLLGHIQKLDKPCPFGEAVDYIRTSGVSKAELKPKDVRQLIDSLLYDGSLEELDREEYRPPLPALKHDEAGTSTGARKDDSVERTDRCYVASHSKGMVSSIMQLPCAKCTIAKVCADGNEVSPQSCVHYDKWMRNLNIDW